MALDKEKKKIYHEIANTVRGLTMDAVEKANSGHPGLPMGCAELGAYLWSEFMRYNPKNPHWFNRDWFVLSAGHGSMFLYSLLHLYGYDLPMEQIKNFRQLHSMTPGHPERTDTPGVEVTTGPLGQGVANAVGIALAYKILEDRFNREGFPIVSNKIVCLASDGCMMEGIGTEASSIAGHLCLNNLIMLYDMNYVTLDGYWKDSCSDDQVMRYRAMGWDVLEIEDGNNLDEISTVLNKLKGKREKPTIVIIHTVIGKGAPNKAGTHLAHGSPLGAEEVKAAKKLLGITDEPFYVSPAVRAFCAGIQKQGEQAEKDWNDLFNKWKKAYPDLAEMFQMMKEKKVPEQAIKEILDLPVKDQVAGRAVSNDVLQILGKYLPHLIGGSADLSESDKTMMKAFPLIGPSDFSGRNIKFGIREFGMSGMANGMANTLLRPYVGTFFCFSDYARNAVRLSALGRYPSIFVYTHDSIGLGEDGPTHQPVEHLASFRAMPRMVLWRPGDANEVKAAWISAIRHTDGPVILVFTRQPLPTLKETKRDFKEGALRGGYILIEEDKKRPIDFTLIGTGSELHLAVDVAKELKDKNIRVVSLPCWQIFEKQDAEYKKRVLGGNIGKRVSIEAGATLGWERYIGSDGIAIGLDDFGHSAPIEAVMKCFGFTKEQIIQRILAKK